MANDLNLTDMETCYKAVQGRRVEAAAVDVGPFRDRAGDHRPAGPVGSADLRGADLVSRPVVRGGQAHRLAGRGAGPLADLQVPIPRHTFHLQPRAGDQAEPRESPWFPPLGARPVSGLSAGEGGGAEPRSGTHHPAAPRFGVAGSGGGATRARRDPPAAVRSPRERPDRHRLGSRSPGQGGDRRSRHRALLRGPATGRRPQGLPGGGGRTARPGRPPADPRSRRPVTLRTHRRHHRASPSIHRGPARRSDRSRRPGGGREPPLQRVGPYRLEGPFGSGAGPDRLRRSRGLLAAGTGGQGRWRGWAAQGPQPGGGGPRRHDRTLRLPGGRAREERGSSARTSARR
ncbi:MAG: hypothetical protein KatS3mg011_1989 [Acidimicrobiia bacterium]|nr:MAG: hypothetical protein KatS3mg011_1989 [Acidimicrobiia bacterium]